MAMFGGRMWGVVDLGVLSAEEGLTRLRSRLTAKSVYSV